jgi:hypothetical protein
LLNLVSTTTHYGARTSRNSIYVLIARALARLPRGQRAGLAIHLQPKPWPSSKSVGPLPGVFHYAFLAWWSGLGVTFSSVRLGILPSYLRLVSSHSYYCNANTPWRSSELKSQKCIRFPLLFHLISVTGQTPVQIQRTEICSEEKKRKLAKTYWEWSLTLSSECMYIRVGKLKSTMTQMSVFDNKKSELQSLRNIYSVQNIQSSFLL